jgi:hypothetical protein
MRKKSFIFVAGIVVALGVCFGIYKYFNQQSIIRPGDPSKGEYEFGLYLGNDLITPECVFKIFQTEKDLDVMSYNNTNTVILIYDNDKEVKEFTDKENYVLNKFSEIKKCMKGSAQKKDITIGNISTYYLGEEGNYIKFYVNGEHHYDTVEMYKYESDKLEYIFVDFGGYFGRGYYVVLTGEGKFDKFPIKLEKVNSTERAKDVALDRGYSVEQYEYKRLYLQ